ncbi:MULTISPECIES: hypothetical protein [unclassified Crossiella]|uniref:hypothetical protein n=1 Tax=unclassified Crossiella TaxID=2620835 RepID=UPI001FFFD5F6|nr:MULTISPECIES: hypothetical protein [unclassified Crossiella]MCK2240980.1 hypothetical protein [Crossiella sp. S99.2]MCK2253876.1 hypothetical protein [Crossiella sp. S99.1]
MDDPNALHDETTLVACLVREPGLAAGRTAPVACAAEEFTDAELGQLFDRLRAIRETHPQLTGVGIRYNLEPDLHAVLDRALAWWDQEANQTHPRLPAVADEVEMAASAVNRRWRKRQIASVAAEVQHRYASGDHDGAGELAAELREMVRTSGEAWEEVDPYAEHTGDALIADLAHQATGRGLAVHPRLDALLHHRTDWLGELVLLGAKTKVGKTRLAGWWASRIADSAERTCPEAQVMFFCTELTRAELVALVQGYCPDGHLLFDPTPGGRPRMLLFGKEFFARIGGDPQARLRAVKTELRRFAAANLRWAQRHDLVAADCWFAGIIIDYLTSMLSSGNDFATCEEFVRGVDTSLRVFDPGWLGLDSARFADLAGLHCTVLVCEQVNARREPPARVTVDPRTGKTHRPPLDPPSPTEINGARSTFETATVYLMLARDPDGRVHPPEQAVLRVSGRSVASCEIPLRFGGGVFEVLGDAPSSARQSESARQSDERRPVPKPTVAAEPEPTLHERVWAIPAYVLAPPANTGPDGSLVPSQDRYVPADPTQKGWSPPGCPPSGQTSLL